MCVRPSSALAQPQPSCGERAESEPPLGLLLLAAAKALGEEPFALYDVLTRGLLEGWIQRQQLTGWGKQQAGLQAALLPCSSCEAPRPSPFKSLQTLLELISMCRVSRKQLGICALFNGGVWS